MNRKEAVDLLPIIKAFSEGISIQYRIKDNKSANWNDVDKNYHVFSPHSFQYRIKPKSAYRPFANAEECWQEMLKYQPFGVVKDKCFANYQTHRAFTCLTTKGCYFCGYEDETFESGFKNLLFADGLPFGVKIEEN